VFLYCTMGNLTDSSVNADFGTHSGQESLGFVHLGWQSLQLSYNHYTSYFRFFTNMRGEIKGMEIT